MKNNTPHKMTPRLQTPLIAKLAPEFYFEKIHTGEMAIFKNGDFASEVNE